MKSKKIVSKEEFNKLQKALEAATATVQALTGINQLLNERINELQPGTEIKSLECYQ